MTTADPKTSFAIMGELSEEHVKVRALLSRLAGEATLENAEGVAKQVNAARDLLLGGLDEHIRVENEQLFPVVGELIGSGVVGTFVEEHVRILELRDKVLDGAAAEQVPLASCLELCDLLESHTVREDQMLFPAARQALDWT